MKLFGYTIAKRIQLTGHDEIHKYREDITQLKREHNSALQYAAATQNTSNHPFAVEDLHNLRRNIETAQKILNRLMEKELKRDPPSNT